MPKILLVGLFLFGVGFFLVCGGFFLFLNYNFKQHIQANETPLLQNVVASKRHHLMDTPPVMQKTQIPCLNKMATVDTPNYTVDTPNVNLPQNILGKVYKREKRFLTWVCHPVL